MARQTIAGKRHRREGLSFATRARLALAQRREAFAGSLRRAFQTARTLPVLKWGILFFEGLTPMGWSALACGLIALGVGRFFAWSEVTSVGIILLVSIFLSLLWSIGRSGHVIELNLARTRVTVGEQALGELHVSNPTKRTLPSSRIELHVGVTSATFTTQRLAAQSSFDEPFGISTQRRGVITVGPASTVRGDALGLVRRVQTWSQAIDLYIHPLTVPLTTSATGLIRDIEGATTHHLSSSDVSFHALRDYIPGDDRRNMHWKTTARTGKLMVRQFEETRRSHMLIILDVDDDVWATPEEFEIGVSAAASLVRTTMGEAKEASIFTQHGRLKTPTMTHALDSLCVVDTLYAAERLPELAHKAGIDVAEASVAVVVTGSNTTPSTMHNALAKLPLNMVVIALRIDSQHPLDMRSIGGFNVVSLPTLDDLSVAVWKALG